MRKKELYIPLNVPEQKDYVAGFGAKELSITAMMFFVSLVLAVIIFITSGSPFYAILAAGMLIALTIMIIRRDRFNESVIDKLRFVREYGKVQKQYEYFYHNIYESEIKE